MIILISRFKYGGFKSEYRMKMRCRTALYGIKDGKLFTVARFAI